MTDPPQGLIGKLPRPAWLALVDLLSAVDEAPDAARRATVLALRSVCKALLAVVAEYCVGGAGWLELCKIDMDGVLEAAQTASLGRALLVDAHGPDDLGTMAEMATAVRRGHMLRFAASEEYCEVDVRRAAEAVLLEASREDQLVVADMWQGDEDGWRVDTMAQLKDVRLFRHSRQAVEAILRAGVVQRVLLSKPYGQWSDLSILSSLQDLRIFYFDAPLDLAPLADVPKLGVWGCTGLTALSAPMRNICLAIEYCYKLTDVSGLAGSCVGHLTLRGLERVEDVSAIGAMQPPPRTVVLEKLYHVPAVSLVAGIHRLEVNDCAPLDKEATLAALEGQAVTIRWDRTIV